MLYIYIDDIVEFVCVVMLFGIYEICWLFVFGVGLSLECLWLGLEGSLGIIIEVWIWLYVWLWYWFLVMFKFDVFFGGVEVVWVLLQVKFYFVNCCFVSVLEVVVMGLGDVCYVMLLLGFEFEFYLQWDVMNKVLEICKWYGGWVCCVKVWYSELVQGVCLGVVGSWWKNFFKVFYLWDIMVCKGMVMEIFEIVVIWDQFEVFYVVILVVVQGVFDRYCCGCGLIICCFIYIYFDGFVFYYLVVVWSEWGWQVEIWDVIKVVVLDVIIVYGGMIMYYYVVGCDYCLWYECECGEFFSCVFVGVKLSVDFEWVFNFGVFVVEWE